MGADHRMFPGPWGDLADFTAHDWPAYSGETTLAEIAASVARERGIEDGDTVIGHLPVTNPPGKHPLRP